MRKLSVLFAILLLCVGVRAQIVQSVGCSKYQSSCTITLPGGTTAGNNVHIAVATRRTTGNVTSVTVGGVSCGKDGAIPSTDPTGPYNGEVEFWTCANIAASQTLVSITLNAMAEMQALAWEVSGEPTSGYLDAFGTATFFSSGDNTNIQLGAVTTSNAHDLVIGFGYSFGAESGAPVQNGAWVPGPTVINSDYPYEFTSVYQKVSTTDSYSPLANITDTNVVGVAVAYKQTFVQPATTPTFSLTAGNYVGNQTSTISTNATCSSYVHWNTTGTNMSSGTLGTSVSITSSETVYGQVIGCPGYSDSAVGNASYVLNAVTAPPTASQAGGTYLIVSPVTLVSSTPGASVLYCLDTTNTCIPNINYAGGITISSSGYLRFSATASGFLQSPTTGVQFTLVQDIPLVSDNFAVYYNSHVGANHGAQYPLDTSFTSGKWTVNPAISGTVNFSGNPAGMTDKYLSPLPPSYCQAISGICLGSIGTSVSVYTGGTLGADQFTKANVWNSETTVYGAGVCVRYSTTTKDGVCLNFNLGRGTVSFHVISNGSDNTVFSSSISGISFPLSLELRSLGTTFQPLLNGVTPPGFPSTITDSTISTGSPAIFSDASGISDFVAGGVGNSNYTTNPYTPPAYQIYTDNTESSDWQPNWPWITNQVQNGIWGDNFAVYPAPEVPSGYGIGIVGGMGEMRFDGLFESEQWIEATWARDTAIPGQVWQGVAIKDEPYAPGYDNGLCVAHDMGFNCSDTVGYYVETEFNRQAGGACPSSAKESCGFPFAMPLKYSDQGTPWNNEYDFLPLAWSPRAGDQIFLGYRQGHIRTYCKAGPPTARWQPNTSYPPNSYVLDSNGNYQVNTSYPGTTGTSGSVEPTTWGTTWDMSGHVGAITTDGSVNWEFFGAPCPAAPTNNGWALIFDVEDLDLLYETGGPVIAANSSALQLTQHPATFSNISMGSGWNTEIDTAPISVPEQPKFWAIQ